MCFVLLVTLGMAISRGLPRHEWGFFSQAAVETTARLVGGGDQVDALSSPPCVWCWGGLPWSKRGDVNGEMASAVSRLNSY